MAELTEQQGHLSSILSQQKELANDINQLNAKLPEPEAPAEETKTEVVK